MIKLDLWELYNGLPAITPAFGTALAEACAVCLNDQNHQPGVELQVTGEITATLQLYWQDIKLPQLSLL